MITSPEEQVTFPARGDVELFGYLSWPLDPACSHGFVLLHPWGTLGGSLYNNVIFQMMRDLSARSMAALCFNFRGVGPSTGHGSWTGAGELDDVRAACAYFLEVARARGCPNLRIIICGYSYGSFVSGALVDELESVAGYVAISYPVSVRHVLSPCHAARFMLPLQQSEKPKLFITGTADWFSMKQGIVSLAQACHGPVEHVWVPGASHIWTDHERQLFGPVHEWFVRHFQQEERVA